MLRLREASGEGSLPAPDPSSRFGIGTQSDIDLSLCAETANSISARPDWILEVGLKLVRDLARTLSGGSLFITLLVSRTTTRMSGTEAPSTRMAVVKYVVATLRRSGLPACSSLSSISAAKALTSKDISTPRSR